MTIGVCGSLPGRALRMLGAAAGALALATASPGPGHSEPTESRERAVVPGQRPMQIRPPAQIPHTTASGRPAAHQAQSKPWSIEDALPDNSPATRDRARQSPAPARPQLGRIPLQNGPGTFGIETETKVKPTELPDGRRTPGAETTPHRPPTYFGLSLSVPTSDTSIIPSAAPPMPGPK